MATSTEIATVNNAFGLNLFKKIWEEEQGKNIFLSPFSISVALAMTHLGARGNTASEMSATLQWPSGKEEDTHRGYQTYLSLLHQPSEVYQLSTANRIFIEKKYPVLAQFLEKTNKHYLAEATPSDFSGNPDSEREKINSWVSQQTNNKINDLLPGGSIDPLTRMVLVNAIYFKGKWDNEFDPDRTKPLPFRLSSAVKKEVPMMFAKRKFAYIKDQDLACSAIDIPYKGKDLSMVIILPDKDFGLKDLVKELTAEKLQNLLGKLSESRPVEVRLTMPKFEMTCSLGLKDTLSSMGMSGAFDHSTADFSGITAESDLKISDVVHKAFVQVNEEGTEAAAATGVVMMTRCAMIPRDPLEMKVDHPFLLVIKDGRSHNAALFIGQVTDPSLS